jgi:hypothetical protein
MSITKVYDIFYFYLTSIGKKFDTHPDVKMPITVGKYRLKKFINTARTFPFRKGIYADAAGKTYFAKIWVGSRRDVHYYELKHEIQISQILTSIAKKPQMKRLSKSAKTSFVTYVDHFEEKGRLVYLSNFIDGKTLVEWPNAEKRYDFYHALVTFAHRAGSYCTPHEIRIISQKKLGWFVLLYPALVCYAILKRPKYANLILRGIAVFLRGIPDLYRHKRIVFVHGDIQPNNVMVRNGWTYILDLEQSFFSYPEFETLTSIANRKNSVEFVNSLLDSVCPEHRVSYSHCVCFAAISVYALTYNLTSDLNLKSIDRYLSLLQLIIANSQQPTHDRNIGIKYTEAYE